MSEGPVFGGAGSVREATSSKRDFAKLATARVLLERIYLLAEEILESGEDRKEAIFSNLIEDLEKTLESNSETLGIEVAR